MKQIYPVLKTAQQQEGEAKQGLLQRLTLLALLQQGHL